MAESKPKHAGGRPVGSKQNARAKAKIKTARLLEIAHNIAENKDKGDYRKLGARVSMIATLLKKELPDKSANDITSGGKSVVFEVMPFKQRVDDNNNGEKNNDADTDRVPDAGSG